MAIIHSLKCTVPFSLVVPLLSLAVTHCYLSLVFTRCITLCHSFSLVAPLVVIRCHSWYHSLSLVVFRCHSLYHPLSLVVIRCHPLYHSLSLDVPLVCLFINDHEILRKPLYMPESLFSKVAHFQPEILLN